MEKIVHPRLSGFLEKNVLLFEQQYGFRNKLSTNHALIDITSKIQTVCDKGILACGAYVDFKKAFNTVNHEFLHNKLNHYGIRGTELQWFKTYLKGWQQHTTVLSDISLKKINKHINHDLKLLKIWLRENKISLNASTTEIILFRPKSQSNITKHFNFRISSQYI